MILRGEEDLDMFRDCEEESMREIQDVFMKMRTFRHFAECVSYRDPSLSFKNFLISSREFRS